MYDVTRCTEDGCDGKRAGDGMCARHLFRWALRCRHDSHDQHDHELAA